MNRFAYSQSRPPMTHGLLQPLDARTDRRSKPKAMHNLKNFLFAGADRCGERAAAIHWLIGIARLNNIDSPNRRLRVFN